MKNEGTVFVLDDNLPKLPEFVEQHVYDGAILKDKLLILVQGGNWTDHQYLQELISRLLNHEDVKAGRIQIFGYTNPEFALSDARAGAKPNVVIYDWEYGTTPSSKDSERWLLEILRETDAFVFVYSDFRDVIPPILNKPEFDAFAPKFQLLEKGNASNSVFTSEDFIDQDVMSKFSNSRTIKVQGIEVDFKENDYLKEPKRILDLEAILGRSVLLERLKEVKEISNESIVKMFEELDGYMLFDRAKRFLIAADFPLTTQSDPREEISYARAIKDFGLEAVREAIETGFARV